MENTNYIERYINTDEPVLFETSAPMTDKILEDFNKFSYTKKNSASFVVNLIFAVFMGILGFICLITGNIYLALVNIGGAVVFALFPFFVLKKNSAAANNSALGRGNVNRYKFYQDCFVNTDFYTMSVIPYNIVIDAHETEEYFFIYISKFQAHVIPKVSFLFNTPQEMRKLLTMKLGNRFMVHCE